MKVITEIIDTSEINEMEWIRAAASNSVFDFLDDPLEDIYSLEEGKLFSEQISVKSENKITQEK